MVLEYTLYFFLTLFSSALFGVVGLGSSLVLIPLFSFLGVEFDFAKAIGLFINGVTTLSITLKSLQSGVLEVAEFIPYVLISLLFASGGAYATLFVSAQTVRMVLMIFILLSVVLMFAHLRLQTQKRSDTSPFALGASISAVAFVGGLIGVGGGAIYLPLFMLLGTDAKKSISLTSALIPVVSFSGFASYVTFVPIDWTMLIVVAIAAILGGIIGHKITSRVKDERMLKYFIASILIGVSLWMGVSVFWS